ncbi:MAG: hypothetical protein HYY23_19230, partial [Verrucomicrobia bacterium]|nr:hypothetical protein [Verrucomicrobiota bacterium]
MAILAGGTVTCWLLRVSRNRSDDAKEALGRNSESARTDSFVDQKILKDALALEAQRNQLDQTVWAPELTAQKHEDVFVRLWDALRASADPIELLKNFEFGAMTLGALGQVEILEHHVTSARLGAPARHLMPPGWRSLLAQLQNQGYRIENSEWRHVEFHPATNAAASSVFAVTLHGKNQQPPEQFVVRGQFKVIWRQSPNPADEPYPERIEASALELLRRRGEPAFEWALAREIKPE